MFVDLEKRKATLFLNTLWLVKMCISSFPRMRLVPQCLVLAAAPCLGRMKKDRERRDWNLQNPRIIVSRWPQGDGGSTAGLKARCIRQKQAQWKQVKAAAHLLKAMMGS